MNSQMAVRSRTASAPFVYSFRAAVALDPLPGRFDPTADVRVVDVDGTAFPLVLRDPARCATETITRVRAETSDED